MKTIILKPGVDTREGKAVVRSRIGLEAECVLFTEEENIFDKVTLLSDSETAAILVDESQFMTPEQVEQLTDVVDLLDIPVICYGLRSDFQGKLFPGSASLFALANRMEEVRTICWCGKRATMVLRIDDKGEVVREGNVVVVGGNDKYVSVCRRHFKGGCISR